MKIPFIASLRKSFLKEELSSSQNQAIIRLIEKKDKRFVQTLRPLSLINSDVKILSKVLAQRVKKTFLIFSNQSSYVEGLISNLLKIRDTLKLKDLLATCRSFISEFYIRKYRFGNRLVKMD